MDSTTISELQSAILAFAEEREWLCFHTPKNLSMALSAEAAELMEHFLWDNPSADSFRQLPAAKQAAIGEELADIVIYAMQFSNVTGIDLSAAIKAKIALNAAKYPTAKAKGNSKKYTEL